jgi:hypothetical protein
MFALLAPGLLSLPYFFVLQRIRLSNCFLRRVAFILRRPVDVVAFAVYLLTYEIGEGHDGRDVPFLVHVITSNTKKKKTKKISEPQEVVTPVFC